MILSSYLQNGWVADFTPHFLRWSRAVACGRSTSRVGSFLNINVTLLLTKRRFGGDGVIEARMLRFSSAPSSVKLRNNFTSLPGSLSQLSSLKWLYVDGCKKLEVLPELPPSVRYMNASDCTSLREVTVSSIDHFKYRNNNFVNCPKLFKNVSIDSKGSISKIQCLDSSITSHDFIQKLSAFLD
ncbi:NB-ARC domains-containing protein [Tanacetum coccineum]